MGAEPDKPIRSVEVTRAGKIGWLIIIKREDGTEREIKEYDFTGVLAESTRYILAMLLGRDD